MFYGGGTLGTCMGPLALRHLIGARVVLLGKISSAKFRTFYGGSRVSICDGQIALCHLIVRCTFVSKMINGLLCEKMKVIAERNCKHYSF